MNDFDIRKESEELVKRVQKYVEEVNKLYERVVKKKLEYPLKCYVDDDYRNNLFMHQQNFNKKAEVVILDDNPLSIASYMEEYPENAQKIIDSLEDKK